MQPRAQAWGLVDLTSKNSNNDSNSNNNNNKNNLAFFWLALRTLTFGVSI